MGPEQDQGYRRDHPLTYDTSETAIPENEIVGSADLNPSYPYYRDVGLSQNWWFNLAAVFSLQ